MTIETPSLAKTETEKPITFEDLVNRLRTRATKSEVIIIKGREPIYNFYNPRGMEVKDLLDPDHMPGVTEFQTLIVSEEFANLRGIPVQEDKDISPLEEVETDLYHLSVMSGVASDPKNYEDTPKAKDKRQMYLKSAAQGLERIYKENPIGPNTVVVGVKRCGDNLLDEIKNIPENQRTAVEAKRLRFKGLPNSLGAGAIISEEAAEMIKGKDVRWAEGVEAAGTTESVLICDLRNKEIEVLSASCDAVVVCPAGAALVADLREKLGLKGKDTPCFAGGQLNENWYVVYGDENDRLIKLMVNEFGENAERLQGKQVLGDGGDLTSNTS